MASEVTASLAEDLSTADDKTPAWRRKKVVLLDNKDPDSVTLADLRASLKNLRRASDFAPPRKPSIVERKPLFQLPPPVGWLVSTFDGRFLLDCYFS